MSCAKEKYGFLNETNSGGDTDSDPDDQSHPSPLSSLSRSFLRDPFGEGRGCGLFFTLAPLAGRGPG